MNTVVRETIELLCKNTRSGQVLPLRRCTTSTTTAEKPFTTTQSKSQLGGDVPGLSKKMVDVPAAEVGFPAASKNGTYKNPEYFCYHNTSFFEAEVEMMKYRLPQPSNKATQK